MSGFLETTPGPEDHRLRDAAIDKRSALDDAAIDKRSLAIDEAMRALASDKVAVLMLPARPERRLQVAFEHGQAALLTLGGARTLHRQLGQLLAIADGRPPE